jgi:cytochrome c peroxidase
MRHWQRLALTCTLMVLGLLAAGCQQARRYGPSKPEKSTQDEAGDQTPRPKEKPSPEEKPRPLPTSFAYIVPTARDLKKIQPDVPIKFIHQETEPDKWKKLEQFWTLVHIKPPTPLGPPRSEVRIKVPLGLNDPTPDIPSSNPPTVAKWALGKRLFFDKTYLYPSNADWHFSCATCHQPKLGFTNGSYEGPTQRKAATLINSVYNSYLFWDGRASALEEVVQRVLEDERMPDKNAFQEEQRQHAKEREHRHVWSGVVYRLRRNPDYVRHFRDVFGTQPTQDTIGKALATYLRTILAGDSLYDRARQEAGGKTPGEQHYQNLLDKAALKTLQRTSSKKAEVAKDLVAGQALFRGKARCAQCHHGANFTDNNFHNIGIGESRDEPEPGKEPGRFAQLPIGLKDRRLIGAFKTPTLRGVAQTTAYFHDGSQGKKDAAEALFLAVAYYGKDLPSSPYLDPLLRGLKLSEAEVHNVVLFLRALDGKGDEVVSDPEKQPEGVPAPKS